jgi:hypothetical protein
MSSTARYWIAVALSVLTLGLLYPGLTNNALTINAVVDHDFVQGEIAKFNGALIPPEELALIRPQLNAAYKKLNDHELSNLLVPFGVTFAREAIERHRQLFKDNPVYTQKQTIVVTIQYLYKNGGYLAATLLLLFSVCVPFGKVALYLIALHVRASRREKLLGFINFIGKWSMADVFVVAIYTAYLGAKSSIGVGQAVHFETTYGPGFYWFASYCIVSLAAQQAAVALLRSTDQPEIAAKS